PRPGARAGRAAAGVRRRAPRGLARLPARPPISTLAASLWRVAGAARHRRRGRCRSRRGERHGRGRRRGRGGGPLMGDVEAALAFVAARQGRRALLPQEWAHVLSLDLGWMAPAQARRLVERAQAAGLLTPDGDLLRLALDPAAVQVPPLFRPRPDAE